jgi:hypothetical protein
MKHLVCDRCKQEIARIDEGILEWLNPVSGQVDYSGPPAENITPELRLVHGEAAGDKCLRSWSNFGSPSSLNLSSFVDSDGYLTWAGVTELVEMGTRGETGSNPSDTLKMIGRLARKS